MSMKPVYSLRFEMCQSQHHYQYHHYLFNVKPDAGHKHKHTRYQHEVPLLPYTCIPRRHSHKPGILCHSKVSRAGTSNYIPQTLWDVITCPPAIDTCFWLLYRSVLLMIYNQNPHLSWVSDLSTYRLIYWMGISKCALFETSFSLWSIVTLGSFFSILTVFKGIPHFPDILFYSSNPQV